VAQNAIKLRDPLVLRPVLWLVCAACVLAGHDRGNFFLRGNFVRHSRKSFQDLFLACSNAGQVERRAAGAAAISANLTALCAAHAESTR
jgi:hypothetical protein